MRKSQLRCPEMHNQTDPPTLFPKKDLTRRKNSVNVNLASNTADSKLTPEFKLAHGKIKPGSQTSREEP